VEYFNLGHSHKPKFGLFLPFPDPNLFLLFTSPFFSVLLLLLLYAFHILSGYPKKFGVTQGQSLKMGP